MDQRVRTTRPALRTKSRSTFVVRALIAFFAGVLALGVLATVVVFMATPPLSPGLQELADEPVWKSLPEGSAIWVAARSSDMCNTSESGEADEYRNMGLFVVDRDEALRHYEAVLVDGGWSIETSTSATVPETSEQVVLRATKPGKHALLTMSVRAADRRGVQDVKDGKLVPEGRPDGFDQESDYVDLYGTLDPPCES
jgi:hypothetical protein